MGCLAQESWGTDGDFRHRPAGVGESMSAHGGSGWVQRSSINDRKPCLSPRQQRLCSHGLLGASCTAKKSESIRLALALERTPGSAAPGKKKAPRGTRGQFTTEEVRERKRQRGNFRLWYRLSMGHANLSRMQISPSPLAFGIAAVWRKRSFCVVYWSNFVQSARRSHRAGAFVAALSACVPALIAVKPAAADGEGAWLQL